MAAYASTSRYKLDATNQTASRKDPTATSYTTYTVSSYDTLERIAARYLGSEQRFWEIADINPQIKFPLALEVGSVLRLPL